MSGSAATSTLLGNSMEANASPSRIMFTVPTTPSFSSAAFSYFASSYYSLDSIPNKKTALSILQSQLPLSPSPSASSSSPSSSSSASCVILLEDISRIIIDYCYQSLYISVFNKDICSQITPYGINYLPYHPLTSRPRAATRIDITKEWMIPSPSTVLMSSIGGTSGSGSMSSLSSYIYVTSSESASIWRYNLQTLKWDNGYIDDIPPPMPHICTQHSILSLDHPPRLVVLGHCYNHRYGITSHCCQIYDIITHKWSSSSIIHATSSSSSGTNPSYVVYQNQIYSFGDTTSLSSWCGVLVVTGENKEHLSDDDEPSRSPTDSDASSNTGSGSTTLQWKALRPMISSRRGVLKSVVVNDSILIMGGSNDRSGADTSNIIDEYRPLYNTWHRLKWTLPDHHHSSGASPSSPLSYHITYDNDTQTLMLISNNGDIWTRSQPLHHPNTKWIKSDNRIHDAHLRDSVYC